MILTSRWIILVVILLMYRSTYLQHTSTFKQNVYWMSYVYNITRKNKENRSTCRYCIPWTSWENKATMEHGQTLLGAANAWGKEVKLHADRIMVKGCHFAVEVLGLDY